MNWYPISRNMSIIEIENNLDLPWSWNGISENLSLTWEFCVRHQDEPLDWHYVCQIIPLKDLPKIVDCLANNPLHLANNQDIINNWQQYDLCQNPSIVWEDIQKYNWNCFKFGDHPNITWDIIAANLDKFHDWRLISLNPNLTWRIIHDNASAPWKWRNLSANKFLKHKKFNQ